MSDPLKKILLAVFLLFLSTSTWAQETAYFDLQEKFSAEEAHQAVAVDKQFLYAIDNHRIGKYEKQTGKKIDSWAGSKSGPIKHLNSGIIRGDTLFCAHSNFPELPMVSSIEMWDVTTMEHIGSYSFGVYKGSGTWVDWHNNSWWVVFAHYARNGGEPGKGPAYTTLVQFDNHWQPKQSWIFPEVVTQKFHPNSNSGGAWGPDGKLYVTGHDAKEIYRLELPKAGSTLHYLDTFSFPGEGQGIAWDPVQSGILYGIIRDTHEIIQAKLIKKRAP